MAFLIFFKALIHSINNFEQLETDLKSLRASERVKAIIELSKFILPTLKATEMSLNNETKFQAIEIELK